MKVEYAIVIKNKTRLESLTERFNTKAQAKFYIESVGGNFQDYVDEHDTFHHSLDLIQKKLIGVVKHKLVDRSFLTSFIFNHEHLVIVVGQDGLVANTAKYADNIPIIGVNPDISRYDGVLLPFNTDDFLLGVEDVLAGNYLSITSNLAEAQLNDGQRLLAFNDLFIGPLSHTSARYIIQYNNQTERHSSSGVIVSTKSGSTGWLSSLYNMSFNMQSFLNKNNNAKKRKPVLNDKQLMFVVREPFSSKTSETNLCLGVITHDNCLELESLMPQGGVIFSDGIEKDFLHFNSGTVVKIGLAKEKAILIQKK